MFSYFHSALFMTNSAALYYKTPRSLTLFFSFLTTRLKQFCDSLNENVSLSFFCVILYFFKCVTQKLCYKWLTILFECHKRLMKVVKRTFDYSTNKKEIGKIVESKSFLCNIIEHHQQTHQNETERHCNNIKTLYFIYATSC